MKKIIFLLSITIITTVFSCKNDGLKEFADFDYTTTYFPYQYPVRTLVLGDYVYDNQDDNNLKFKISARMGGVYNNNSNIKVTYKVDPTLVTKLSTAANLFDGKTTATADTLMALPSQYYTLSPTAQFEIAKGSFTGGVDVQLTDAFLDDLLAAKTKYVIPLRILTSTTDSVLQGKTTLTNPDSRIAGNWVITPKDFTLFGIKFVNKYHGKYLHRGVSAMTDSTTSTLLQTNIYHQKYVELDELWSLQTMGRNKVKVTGVLRKTPTSPGNFSMNLTFDSSNNCVVSTAPGSPFKVTGTGKFVKNGDKWGGTAKDAIYLNYVVREGVNKHAATDTLVFRDKAVTFLEFAPVILP